jgi:uncharacterized phage protein gp47/JayE
VNNINLESQLASTAQALSLTTPATPTATSIIVELLQLMAAQSGTISDFNPGSNIRTLASIMGLVMEQQNITNRVTTAQNVLSGLFSFYNLTPPSPAYATGSVTFTLPQALSTDLTILSGTQVGTTGGLAFSTIASLTLEAGSLSGSVGIQAQQTGTLYNVAANSITQMLSTIPVTVSVTNPNPTTGGTNAPSLSTLVNILSNTILSNATSTPSAIAAASYGVSTASGETTLYTTVYEPWVTQLTAGTTITASPGFTVYVDNGSGTASETLLEAVLNKLTGTPQYVPAGVPFSVLSVTPVNIDCTVDATTTTAYSGSIPYISTLITNAVNNYFSSLNFGDTVDGNALEVDIVNAVSQLIQSASVTLTPTSPVTVPAYQRAILSELTLNIIPPS